MDAGRCPDKQTLFGYMMGTISEGEAETVDQHLASCSECERTAEALEGLSDTMTRALRQPAEGDAHAAVPECGQVLQKLRKLQIGNPRVGSLPPALPTLTKPRRITRLGDYDLLTKLGQGGMGTVYKAQHTRLKRVVAVKVLPKNRLEDEVAVARFEREMEAVGRLDHPNIVRAMDAREVDRIRFLVMEYVDGLDLSQVVDRCGPLSIADASETIRQAALGLECSRENGLVHRDLKPSNLMLTTQGQVKVLDLGLAQIQEAESLGEEVTGLGQVMGTPDYISPEQALESHTVDIRTDIYSLGCTLYCLLVGHPPFVGPDYDTPMKKVTGQIRDTVPSIQVLKPGIPKPITRLLERMLVKDPKQRVASPSEVAGVLAPFCEGSKLIGLLRHARSLDEQDETGKSRIETGELQASPMIDTSREDLAPGKPEGDSPAAAPLDPYHRWLGIPPAAQPANHYGLLGLAVFEDDPEVIRDAAARQMAHVRTYELGQHVELSQKILNELGAAKACLLNVRKKAAYDARLRTDRPSQPIDERKPPEPPPVSAELLASVEKPAARIKIERLRSNKVRSKTRRSKPPRINTPHIKIPNMRTPRMRIPRFKLPRFNGKKPPTFAWIAVAAAALFVLSAVAINITSGTVRITITPGDPDAEIEVTIDDKVRKVAALDGPIRLALRDHRLTVSVPGYERHEQTFRIERGNNGELTVTLVPLAPKPTELPQYFTDSHLGMKFKLIPAGQFVMGSAEHNGSDETPPHEVEITKPFYLGICEVTQEQYEKVMKENPSRHEEPSWPVEKVSWEDATEFCAKLSKMDSHHDYRLPTESEWEYACRAGTTTRYSSGDDLKPEHAWFDDNSGGEIHPVGEKRPNAWGLYDMHGNVWEWCSDWYDGNYYENSPLADPTGPARGSNRVLRGGSCCQGVKNCRSAFRYVSRPDFQYDLLGFRVVAVSTDVPPQPTELPQDFADSHLGMKFKLIPAGQFMMGSPEDAPDKSDDETPQHEVRLTEPFYLGVHEVTQEQYERVMQGNPSRFEGPTLPVERVSWEDAKEFCTKLSKLDSRYEFRLPTEAEWEYACRGGTTTRYGCGDDLDPRYAWFDDNSGGETHPVGQKRSNAWGLYDMHGNVGEWCADYYVGDYYRNSASQDPTGPTPGSSRVHRGGSWDTVAWYCRAAYRNYNTPARRDYHLGFRVAAIPVDSVTAPGVTTPRPEPIFDPTPPGEVITNRLGMKFRLIPAGEFMMGSLENDPDKEDDEIPRHRVWITRDFYLGVHEVTQEQYEKLMGENPSHFKGPTLPVEQVSWEGATAFCEKLSEDDADFQCRLPTEAEWEYACRAGTTTRYCCGDDFEPQYGRFSGNSERTNPVGQTQPNRWGLCDMHGNVCEWCQDWYAGSYYANSSANDPGGPATGALRVYRGGCWNYTARRCRSAIRYGFTPDYRNSFIGFRVVLVPVDSVASPIHTVSLPQPAATPTEPEVSFEYSTNSLGMKFKLIPAGKFMMGSPRDDPDKESGETPPHQVRITNPFEMGVHEVTQEQYSKVTGENPSRFKEPSLPVERVSWDDATAFCAELSSRETGFRYRLPTEAEWEYACRAGTTTRYSCGDELDSRFAWFGDGSEQGTHPVGKKRANAWGLHDMHGNVWEWCQDFHGSDYYAHSPTDDPWGPTTGFSRVLRGGSWVYTQGNCRSALRFMGTPDLRGNNLGFRVARVPVD